MSDERFPDEGPLVNDEILVDLVAATIRDALYRADPGGFIRERGGRWTIDVSDVDLGEVAIHAIDTVRKLGTPYPDAPTQPLKLAIDPKAIKRRKRT